MEKTVKVTLPARKAIPVRQTTKVVVMCDLDSKPVQLAQRKCTICSRDICEKHLVREYDGDYARIYCTICHPLFMPAQADLDEQHWKDEEALLLKVKRISLATPKDKS